ncbi:hypothetical protein DYB37_002200 [Aphanomyces astaci]|uniref:Uncharacterized protein n=1 Tax=Aphanomyces astaci TaxID=112090 RepID=A0A418E5T8_APHAT|nr:hypothetical protein DYB35_002945 [Aphanomyces astaci]RHZ06307.1 hypothetical protein DYB37_002200 [Aphanomyces astaci]
MLAVGRQHEQIITKRESSNSVDGGDEVISAHSDHRLRDDDHSNVECKGCRSLLTENQLLRELLLRTSPDAQQIIHAFDKRLDNQRQRLEVVGGLKIKSPVNSSHTIKVKPTGALSQPITPDVFRKLSHSAALELAKVHPSYKELYDLAANPNGSLFERVLSSDAFTEEQKRKQVQLALLRQKELNDLDTQPRIAVKSPKAREGSHISTSPRHGASSPQHATSPRNSLDSPGDNYFKLHNNVALHKN